MNANSTGEATERLEGSIILSVVTLPENEILVLQEVFV